MKEIEIWILMERWHRSEINDYPDVNVDAILDGNEVKAEIVNWAERALARARKQGAAKPNRFTGYGISGSGNHRKVYGSLRPDGKADPTYMKEGVDFVTLCEVDYLRTEKTLPESVKG